MYRSFTSMRKVKIENRLTWHWWPLCLLIFRKKWQRLFWGDCGCFCASSQSGHFSPIWQLNHRDHLIGSQCRILSAKLKRVSTATCVLEKNDSYVCYGIIWVKNYLPDDPFPVNLDPVQCCARQLRISYWWPGPGWLVATVFTILFPSNRSRR